MSEKRLFGWFSSAQASYMGIAEYLTPNAEKVLVTSVTSDLYNPGFKGFPDMEFVGIVSQRVRKVSGSISLEEICQLWADEWPQDPFYD